MRLLVVEDEKKAAEYLRKGFAEVGYAVDIAHDGEEGLFLARDGHYALIILDVLLPKLDGWSVMKRLRAAGIETPVLFLTARDSVKDRVFGLELGADDYLIKPFAFSELLARVRSVLRRGPARTTASIHVGDLEIDLAHRKITRCGARLDLTSKEFMLLTLLARKSGEVLSRTLIAEEVWDLNFDSDTNIVDVHMCRLRSKIDGPFERPLIHTVRGVGYVLEER